MTVLAILPILVLPLLFVLQALEQWALKGPRRPARDQTRPVRTELARARVPLPRSPGAE